MSNKKKMAVIFFGKMSTGKETQAKSLYKSVAERGFSSRRFSCREFEPDAIFGSFPEDAFVCSVTDMAVASIAHETDFLIVTGLCNTVNQARHLSGKLVSAGFPEHRQFPVLLRGSATSRFNRLKKWFDTNLADQYQWDEYRRKVESNQNQHDQQVDCLSRFYSSNYSITDLTTISFTDSELSVEVINRLSRFEPKLLVGERVRV